MPLFFNIFLCLFSASLFAVQKDAYFDHISLEHGLNQVAIYSLANDRFGYTWIGTQDGLHRFDGNKAELVNLSANQQPNYRYIRDVTVINDNLYVATTDGLVVVNLLTGEKIYPNVFNAAVYSVIKVNKTIWLGTSLGVLVLNQQHEIDQFYGSKKIALQYAPLIKRYYPSFCNATNPTFTCYNFVRTLVFEKESQTVWLGSDTGLFKFTLADHVFHHYILDEKFPSSNTIRQLLIDKYKVLWVASYFGLHRLELPQSEDDDELDIEIEHIYPAAELKQSSAVHKPGHEPAHQVIDSLPNHRILSLAQDNLGDIWVGSNGGLSRHSNNLEMSKKGGDNQYYQKGWDNFFANRVSTHALPNNVIRSLLADKEGRIWAGTNKGVAITNTERNKVAIYRATHNEKLNNYILSFSEQYANVYWVGTQSGLYIFDHQTTQVITELNGISVYDTLIDKSIIWASTNKGLFKVDMITRQVIQHYHHKNTRMNEGYIYSLVKYHEQLWLGSTNGLYKLNLKTGQWRHWRKEEGLVHSEVYSLMQHQDKLWIGTEKGLSILDLQTEKIKNYAQFTTLPLSATTSTYIKSPWVFAVHPINGSTNNATTVDTRFMIATNDGIYLFDTTTEKFRFIGITQGNAYSIIKDAQNIYWITANNGLYAYDFDSELIQKFEESQGFASDEYNLNATLINSKGELLLGGINGFVVFAPKDFYRTIDSSSVFQDSSNITNTPQNNDVNQQKQQHISNIMFNNAFYSLWDKLPLTNNQPLFNADVFTINYTDHQVELFLNNPYFATTSPNSIHPRVLNLGKKFNTRKQTINLSRIDSGYYKIPLSLATNNFITVTKNTHPLVSWWAITLYVLVFLAIFYFTIRYFLTVKSNQALRLSNKIIFEQKHEIEQNLLFKQSLYLQIQHSFKSPVFACVGLSAQINKILKISSPVKLASIERKNNKLAAALNEISTLIDDFIFLSQKDYQKTEKSKQYILSTVDEIKLLFVDIKENLYINFEVLCDLDSNNSLLATDHIIALDKSLYLILENIIANAVKFSEPESNKHLHSGDMGVVQVIIKKNGRFLHVVIKDNGCGFAESDLSNIFTLFYRGKNKRKNGENYSGTGVGLTNAKQLIDNINGKIYFSNNVPHGTVVSLIIPLVS